MVTQLSKGGSKYIRNVEFVTSPGDPAPHVLLGSISQITSVSLSAEVTLYLVVLVRVY